MKYATVTEARAKLPDLIGTSEPVALTRHGKPVAVLVDVQRYRDLVLSNHLVKDPERLREAYREHREHQRQAEETGEPSLREKLDRLRVAVHDFEAELERRKDDVLAAEAVEG
jgi:prevent-host-death family protein